MGLAKHSNAAAPVLSHFSLEGKNALVTGGSRGIGLEVTRGLLEAGANVAFTYSSTKADELEKIVADLSGPNPGKKVLTYKCSISDKASVFEAVEAANKDLGGLDIVVGNAGIGTHFKAEEYPEDEFHKIMDVNFNGAFWTAQAAAKVMKGNKTKGSIIFTASISGSIVNIPQPQAPYNASKAALIHLAKSLAVEWTDFARVNCISPGYIDTEMLNVHPKAWRDQWFAAIPGARLCDAAELKGAYVFLASEASSYMTGANIILDGGYSLP